MSFDRIYYLCAVSNLDNLLERFQSGNQIKRLKTLLESNTSGRIHLKGFSGDMPYFALSTLSGDRKNLSLYVSDSKENAAYIYNTLQNIMDKSEIGFFPDSFKRPMIFEELNNNNVQERTEIVNRINSDHNKIKILVTYPEAIFEKVIKPSILEEHKIVVTIDESLDVDTMISVLVEFDFKRVDYVYEPGQFSIRGGIIDIFNYANDWPFRIELFDDEVESIRHFDPTTQLSINNLKKISLIPNVNSRFDSEDKVSFLEVLPKSSVIWIEEETILLDKLQQCFIKLGEFEKSVSSADENLIKLFKEKSFVFPKDIINKISDFKNIYINTSTHEIKGDLIEFKSRPQPNFNKNFKLLIDNLEKNTKAGYENYIFAANTRQIERFYQIFEDLDAKVSFHPIPKSINAGFIDDILKIACYTDHQIFQRFHRYNLRKGFSKDKALSVKMLKELKVGDFVTHIDHGVGKYMGLETIEVNGRKQESMRLVYKNNDILFVSINSMHKVSKFVGKDGTAPKIDKLGSDRWKKLKSRTKRKIKDIARELIILYAKRKAAKGYQFKEDDYLQLELESSFLFEDTPDQEKATIAVKKDMESPNPMDRLICGDVGFGKTEIAVRAAFKAILSGKQVAILVPTTILALQHYKTFSDRLGNFAVEIDYLNRFKTAKEKTQIYKKLEAGSIDLIIGTHALLSDKVKFKDLGLLVLDEEQKFGVSAKEKLRKFKVNVDTLTLTATPIPRTLQFSLMGSRDMSLINTPPPNRQPIYTERRTFNEELIIEAINYEIARGGQVFFIHNRIKTLDDVASIIKRLVPDARVVMAHGQLESKELERKLLDFVDYKYDVLVSTNIIETGLDIPNANTMFINNANQFGLSDLHQLRGRVGRSNKKAFCYLLAPPLSVLTPEARKRLKTLEEFNELGSGFNIAMRDLDIRGAGNLLGGEQSGFITDIGYETYMKILEEAMHELKESEFKELYKSELRKDRIYVRDVEVDIDSEILIPDFYVKDIQERLNLYSYLVKIKDEEGIEKFRKELKDRFGNIPHQIDNLFEGLRVKWICKSLGFERFSLKSKKMRLFFISNPQSSFYDSDIFQSIMIVVNQDKKSGFIFKQTSKHYILIKDNVRSMKGARLLLERIDKKVKEVMS